MVSKSFGYSIHKGFLLYHSRYDTQSIKSGTFGPLCLSKRMTTRYLKKKNLKKNGIVAFSDVTAQNAFDPLFPSPGGLAADFCRPPHQYRASAQWALCSHLLWIHFTWLWAWWLRINAASLRAARSFLKTRPQIIRIKRFFSAHTSSVVGLNQGSAKPFNHFYFFSCQPSWKTQSKVWSLLT